jgi:hypothetical protein
MQLGAVVFAGESFHPETGATVIRMKTSQQLSEREMASAEDSWRIMASIGQGASLTSRATLLTHATLVPCNPRQLSKRKVKTSATTPIHCRCRNAGARVGCPFTVRSTIPNFGALWCGSVRFGALYSVPPLSAKTDHTDFHTGFGPILRPEIRFRSF